MPANFPHLIVISDADMNVARAMQVVHPGASATGGDTNAPTTFLVDGAGKVRWMFRPGSFFETISDFILKTPATRAEAQAG